MNVTESLRLSVNTIKSHKLRAFLTTLGVMIGVMTVIGMLALIDGLNTLVASQLAALGTNTLHVERFPWTLTSRELIEYRRRPNVTMEDAEVIQQEVELAQLSAPSLSSTQTVRFEGIEVMGMQLVGTTPEYQFILEIDVAGGRQMLDVDVTQSRDVAMIGATVAEELFGARDPIGLYIRVGQVRFNVIAVLEERGTLFGADQDNMTIIPITSFTRHISGPVMARGGPSVSVLVQPPSPELMDETAEQIRSVLRRERGLRYDQEDNFSINTAEQLMETYQTLTTGVFGLMIGVTALSLVVGGIGIMNIMYVSVSERIREIGIRKAVGAKARDIRMQFLFEAVTLSCVGGAVGMLLGFIIAWGVSAIIDFPTAVSWWSIMLGFGFSVGVGVFFGWYPAKRAAGMDPIEALRYE
ncbi:ABC transporter permease [Chitinispirillales bacterium ANBcel5]|uniref:ABC transporter permease n=1 Tax=Cellulosispirillum alkaliphilum TaxID=3039283 RepID=UPI002A533F28|nr:ABC transporter permease [Chitinispirillales bacterium ANBcel5]